MHQALRWTICLAAAVLVPFLLPVGGSLVALAAFVGLIGSLLLFARSWLLALLPPVAVLGPYFIQLEIAGINVFGFRILLMMLAVFSTPLTASGSWWFNTIACRWFLFLLVWFSYGLFSLSWTPDVAAGLLDIVVLVFALALFLTMFSLRAHHTEHLDKLRFGWTLALVVTAAGAFREIVTGTHLPLEVEVIGTAQEVGTGTLALRSMLGHQSLFGGFMLLTVPFVLWSVERSRGLPRLLYLGGLAVIGALIMSSGSRLSLLGFVAQLGVYVVLFRLRWLIPLAAAGAVAVALLIHTEVAPQGELAIVDKLVGREAQQSRSIGHRTALTLNGLWMAIRTWGIGIGAGGFESEIDHGDNPVQLPVRGVKGWNAHNLWVEVLSEYGVLVFGAFTAILAWLWMVAWRARRLRTVTGDDEPGVIARMILVGLVGYVFYGVAAGTILLSTQNWMFLTSVVVMAAHLAETQRARRRVGAAAATGGEPPGLPQPALHHARRRAQERGAFADDAPLAADGTAAGRLR